MKTELATRFLSVLLAVGFIFTACEKENDDLSEGFSQDIQNFVPDSTIQKLRELGMVINEGKIPPNIEGYYLSSLHVMINSNVPNERYEIGHRFNNQQYHFYEQDNEQLSIKVDKKGLSQYGNITSESKGDGAFLSGYGDSFTAFLLEDGYSLYNDTDSAFWQMLEVISGVITDEGIENFQSAIWMLNDYGDPLKKLIPINSGRVFEESDSIATIELNPKSGYLEQINEQIFPLNVDE